MIAFSGKSGIRDVALAEKANLASWPTAAPQRALKGGQPQHLHDVRHPGKLLQAGLDMFVGGAQADDGHHPQAQRATGLIFAV
jgi:hypothetical protein